MEWTALELREVLEEQEHELGDIDSSVFRRIDSLAELGVAEADVDWLVNEEDVCVIVPCPFVELRLSRRVRDTTRTWRSY